MAGSALKRLMAEYKRKCFVFVEVITVYFVILKSYRQHDKLVVSRCLRLCVKAYLDPPK